MDNLEPSKVADHRYYLEGKEGKLLRREACTPGTRVRLLDDIIQWVKNISPDSPDFYWLFGPAGSGKSTIAYTIANRFEFTGDNHEDVILGGNFFCSRQFEETKQSKCIIRTIAYHLALVCKPFADALRFDIVYRDPKAQIDGLLVQPWQASKAARDAQATSPPHYLIVIDALDEIDGEGGLALLSELFKTLNDGTLPGLKFFATSRQDPGLVEQVERFERKQLYRLQDIAKEEAYDDIKTYLTTQLPHFANRAEMKELVGSSDGLFIYAATVVRYLAGYEPDEQEELLERLLSSSDPRVLQRSLSLLDLLYHQILVELFHEMDELIRARRLRILHTFLCAAERISSIVMANLLCPPDKHGPCFQGATALLKGLHAVLYVDANGHVLSYHKSFSDFIFDRNRSQEFFCDQATQHRFLARACFRVMKGALKFNIAQISSSYILDKDNLTLRASIEQNISAVLAYSCHHWSYHLCAADSESPDPRHESLADFLQLRAIFWIETMNLLGLGGRCATILWAARENVGVVCMRHLNTSHSYIGFSSMLH